MAGTKKEIVLFVIIMLLFIAGMIVMIANHITSWWTWTLYVVVWTVAEVKVAKNIHLKWWVWGIIIIGLSVLDYFILQFFK